MKIQFAIEEYLIVAGIPIHSQISIFLVPIKIIVYYVTRRIIEENILEQREHLKRSRLTDQTD